MKESISEQCLRELRRILRDHPRSVRNAHAARARELLVETMADDVDLGTTPRGWAQQYVVGADLASVAAPVWLRFWRRNWIRIVAIVATTVVVASLLTWRANYQPLVGSHHSVVPRGVERVESEPEPFESLERFAFRQGALLLLGVTLSNEGFVDVEVSLPDEVDCCFPLRLLELRRARVGDGCLACEGEPVQLPLTVDRGESIEVFLVYELVNCNPYEEGSGFTQSGQELDVRVLGVHQRLFVGFASALAFDMPGPGTEGCPRAEA